MPRFPVKVLIVDDMVTARAILSKGLSADPRIQVVGSAPDPYAARDMILETRPDVLTLDVEMPRMDGLEFLRKLMPQYPLPVIMVSALTDKGKRTTLDALAAGAVDFVAKPKAESLKGLELMIMELREKVVAAAAANVSGWKGRRPAAPTAIRENVVSTPSPFAVPRPPSTSDKMIAIGASTGGTEAIREIVTKFSQAMPGVVITQHMPAGFTRMFAERLNCECAMEVKEAEDRDVIVNGRILIAPGGKQTRARRVGGVWQVSVTDDSAVNGHCPSVDVLFESVAKAAGAKAIGVILTGMGADGARGLKAMREAGATTFAQDEASCVVYGMPKVAWEIGAAQKELPLDRIAEAVIIALNSAKKS